MRHANTGNSAIAGLLWATTLVATSACAGSGPVLTVEDAIQLALTNNLSLQSAQLGVEEASEKVGAIKATRLPRLDLRGGVKEHLTDEEYRFDQGVWGEYPVIGPVPGRDIDIATNNGTTSYLSAGVTQPLSQLYRLGLAVDQGEVLTEMAAYRAKGSRLGLIRHVKQQYYDMLRTGNDLATIEETIVFYVELDRVVSNYVANGTALRYQQLDVASRLAQQRHDALQLDNALKHQRERMNFLLGRALDTAFSVNQLPDNRWLLPNREQAEQKALHQRPEVVEARLRVEAEQLGYRMKKAEYIPDVEFTANYAQLFNVELIPEQELYIGLHARWEFYDWGRKRDELASQNFKINRARNDLFEVQERTAIQVKQSYREWFAANDLIKVAQLNQAAKREKLSVLMNQYQQQAALLDDVLKAVSELVHANGQANRAILGVWQAQAELERLMGEG